MIKENIKKILAEIKFYPQKVTFVAVTKNRSVEEIKQVIEAGITDIGENRIQEAERKILELRAESLVIKSKIKFHLIGHLQSNKVKKAVEIFDVIQSVDSFELLKKIDNEAQKQNKKMEILLQVNIFEDEKKFGFKTEDLIENVTTILGLSPQLEIKGLMTIAKQGISEQATIDGFKRLVLLKNELQRKDGLYRQVSNLSLPILSMGMSHDYKIALQAGSNMLRIGSKIFDTPSSSTS